MPTYEFRCPQGHDFEKFYRSIGVAESKAICPQCAQLAERVMSASGFAFKGSGFYLTDYGKNAHRDKGTPEPKSGAPAGEGGGSSDGAKSETAKSESKGGDASASSGANSSASNGMKSERSDKPAKSEAKAAEPKAAPTTPKKSTGE